MLKSSTILLFVSQKHNDLHGAKIHTEKMESATPSDSEAAEAV